MRINEIASAEDQMALWRLVSDSVWQAIETQRQQQAQAAQAKAAKAKLKPRGGRKGKSKSAAPMAAPRPPPPKKSSPPANPSTKPNQPPAANPQAQSLAQRQQALAPQKPVTTSAAPNSSIVPKSRVFAPNMAAAAKPEAWSRQA
jgi:ATP-dependent exoDNAse (exonuclease V) beta subunit